jgi:hypothetical protein
MYVTLSLTIVFVLAGDPDGGALRERSPYGPSLPRLTDAEEQKIEDTIERFLRQDIGQLKGEEARRAIRDFSALRQDAIPTLIRGLNRTAKLEHSCPCLLIGKKLERLLLASEDRELLEFARDEIGCDVGRTRHQAVLQDLRLRVTFRMNQLPRRPPAGPTSPRLLTVPELADAASTERGARLQTLLLELEKRNGPEVLPALDQAATSYDSDTARAGRDALDRYLARQGESYVRARLSDSHAEVRQSAARVAANKMPALGRDLVALLADEKVAVRATAHAALVKIAKGEDFGPSSVEASREVRDEAKRRWQDWFDREHR